MPESKEAVSVTVDKKGLGDSQHCSTWPGICSKTYNKPVSELSVEMEDALKAEHCDDCDSDMQF